MRKRWKANRRGYFFLIDSMLAVGVLVIGAFLVFTTYTKTPSREEVVILSEDLMDFLANNKIKDVNNEYGGIGGELWSSGVIDDPEFTLLQQIGEFYAKNNLSTAEKFIVNLTQNTLPSQYEFEVWAENTLLYPRAASQAHNNSKDSTAVLIPSKKIVYGISDEETGDMFGPYKIEVFVWQNT